MDCRPSQAGREEMMAGIKAGAGSFSPREKVAEGRMRASQRQAFGLTALTRPSATLSRRERALASTSVAILLCILSLLMPTPALAQQTDPALVMRKSGPATMNLGAWGNF